MESKLKSLKVVDLRDILIKAHQPAPQKATKSDLIGKIIASKEATAAYNAKYAPKDDLLAPPEDLDWDTVNAPESPVEQLKPPATTQPVSKPVVEETKPAPPPPPSPHRPPAPAPQSSTDDLELEKRKKRADRFGIPLVKERPTAVKAVASAVNERAARSGTKRAAPVAEEVDAEEQERRRKRAERFGTA